MCSLTPGRSSASVRLRPVTSAALSDLRSRLSLLTPRRTSADEFGDLAEMLDEIQEAMARRRDRSPGVRGPV